MLASRHCHIQQTGQLGKFRSAVFDQLLQNNKILLVEGSGERRVFSFRQRRLCSKLFEPSRPVEGPCFFLRVIITEVREWRSGLSQPKNAIFRCDTRGDNFLKVLLEVPAFLERNCMGGVVTIALSHTTYEPQPVAWNPKSFMG